MSRKQNGNVKKRDEVAREVALMYGVSADYVRKICRGDRESCKPNSLAEQIFASYMDLKEGKNRLLEEVKALIPMDKKYPKRKKTTLKDLKKAQNNPEKGATLHLFNDLNN